MHAAKSRRDIPRQLRYLSASCSNSTRTAVSDITSSKCDSLQLLYGFYAARARPRIHARERERERETPREGDTIIVIASWTHTRSPHPPRFCVCVLYGGRGARIPTYIDSQSLWPVNTLSAPPTPDTLDCTRSPLPAPSHFPTGSLILGGEASSVYISGSYAYNARRARLICTPGRTVETNRARSLVRRYTSNAAGAQWIRSEERGVHYIREPYL